MRKPLFALPFLLSLAVACGSSSPATDPGADPGAPDVPADAAPDVPPADVPPADLPPADVPPADVPPADLPPADVPPVDPGWEAVTPPVAWGPEARGFVEKRAIVHLHSNWSHDGCFPDHEGIDPALFKACEDEHRAAPCATGIDLVFQTDHPSDVKHQTHEDALHYRPEAGDVLLKDAQDRVVANKVTCPEGSKVPYFLYYVGCEGSKQMPIGLSGPVPMEIFETSYHDGVPLEQAQAAIAKVHEQGGYAFVAHPEQDDLTVERIKALPLDGIEIFNVHPMLMDALAAGLDRFFLIDRFMTPGQANPLPDLALLLLLKPVANDPLKFDAAAPYIRLTAFGATDIHRNVEIPSLCFDLPSCEPYTTDFPNFAKTLVSGGPVPLADGDRFDSFARSFRWFANRVLVESGKAGDADEGRIATGTGRSYLSFDLMGVPRGFDFFAWTGGKAVEMGREVAAADGVDLYLRVPTLAEPPWGVDFVEAEAFPTAGMVTRIIRATATGTEVLAELPGQGRTWVLKGAPAGAYRVETWVTPTHLAPALDHPDLADLPATSYPYLYSNAIFVR